MSNSIISLLWKRKATRAISNKKLDEDIVNRIINAAQLSASCFNNQPWRYLFLTDQEALEKGRRALSRGNSWARKAPLLVVGYSKPDLDCQPSDGRKYYLFDLGMATQLMLLQATELDLVARPMAGFSQSVIKEEFNIPEEYEVYVMIAIGYEGDIQELDEEHRKMSTNPRKRNPISSNFFKNKFE